MIIFLTLGIRKKLTDYQKIYNKDYFDGRDSFFINWVMGRILPSFISTTFSSRSSLISTELERGACLTLGALSV